MKQMYKSCLINSVLVGVLFVTVLTGCGKTEQTDIEYLSHAKELMDQRDFKGSVLELKNALGKNPDNPEARLLLGQIYIRMENGIAAEKELRRAMALNIPLSALAIDLAQALLLQNEHQKLLDQLAPDSISDDKRRAKLFALRAIALLGLGKRAESEQAVQASLVLNPAEPEALLGLARLAFLEGDGKEALVRVDEALGVDKNYLPAWLLKGEILRFQQDLPQAKQAFDRAIEVDSESVRAYIGRSLATLMAEDYKQAEADADVVLKSFNNHPLAIYVKGVVAYKGNKHEEALALFQKVERIMPDFKPVVFWLGYTHGVLGQYEQAGEYANKYLNSFPDSEEARKLVAAIFLKTNKSTSALETLNPSLAEGIRDVQILALTGEAHRQNRAPDMAVAYFERAVAIEPGNAALRTQLGLSQLAAGENAHALAELETASKMDPTSHQTEMTLILAYLSEKEYDKAIEAITQLERKLPDNPVIHNLRGMAYLGKSNLAKARKSFERAVAVKPGYASAALNLAQLDLQEKQPQAARKRLESIVAVDKKNLHAMLALAQLSAMENKAGEYAGWLKKAADANPTAIQPKLLLVDYHLRKNESQKALILARDTQAAHPDSAEALDAFGKAQFAVGDKEGALETYGKLVTMAPQSPLAHYRSGVVRASMRDVDKARVSFRQALTLKPDYIEAIMALASMEGQSGRYGEALKLAQQAQKQHPQSPAGHVLEGDVLMVQKQYTQAVKVYDKAYGISKSGPLAIKLHQALVLAGNAKDADAKLLQWLDEQPDDFGVRFHLAQSYTLRDQYPQAIRQYELVLKRDLNNVVALNNLAGLYQRQKDPRALTVAEQAYQLAPESAAVLDTLGWLLVEKGDAARAVDLLRQAVKKLPDNLGIRYHYAVALKEAGDKAGARAEGERLLASDRQFPQREDVKRLLQQL